MLTQNLNIISFTNVQLKIQLNTIIVLGCQVSLQQVLQFDIRIYCDFCLLF